MILLHSFYPITDITLYFSVNTYTYHTPLQCQHIYISPSTSVSTHLRITLHFSVKHLHITLHFSVNTSTYHPPIQCQHIYISLSTPVSTHLHTELKAKKITTDYNKTNNQRSQVLKVTDTWGRSTNKR